MPTSRRPRIETFSVPRRSFISFPLFARRFKPPYPSTDDEHFVIVTRWACRPLETCCFITSDDRIGAKCLSPAPTGFPPSFWRPSGRVITQLGSPKTGQVLKSFGDIWRTHHFYPIYPIPVMRTYAWHVNSSCQPFVAPAI